MQKSAILCSFSLLDYEKLDVTVLEIVIRVSGVAQETKDMATMTIPIQQIWSHRTVLEEFEDSASCKNMKEIHRNHMDKKGNIPINF